MTFNLCQWELYEPREKAGGTKGPLKYAQWRVHGFSLTHGYRRLADVAGADLMACHGLFGKLIEMAADQPKGLRDGTIRRHREGPPATVEDIAYNGLFPVEQVRRCLGFLMHPDVNWVQEAPDATPGAGNGGGLREIAGKVPPNSAGDGGGNPAPSAGEVPPNETKPRRNRTEHNEEGEAAEDGISSCSASEHPASVGPHDGVKASTLGQLAMAFGVAAPQRTNDPSPRARQDRADWTTLTRIVNRVVTEPERDKAKAQAAPLLALAKEAANKTSPKANPIAWFVSQCQRRWPKLTREHPDPADGGGVE